MMPGIQSTALLFRQEHYPEWHLNQHVSLRQCLQLSAHNSSIKSQQWLRITNEKKPNQEWWGVKTMVSHSDRFIRSIPSALSRSI